MCTQGVGPERKQESTEGLKLQTWAGRVIGRRDTEEEKWSSSYKRDSRSSQHFLPCSRALSLRRSERGGESPGGCVGQVCSLRPVAWGQAPAGNYRNREQMPGNVKRLHVFITDILAVRGLILLNRVLASLDTVGFYAKSLS